MKTSMGPLRSHTESVHGVELQQIYHGSKFHFQPGHCLVPQADGYVHQSEGVIEALFETRRPQGKISRFDAVFLVADPDLIDSAGGYSDAVYEVVPYTDEGDDEIHLQRSDLAWYSEVYCLLGTEPADENDAQAIQLQVQAAIDAYWAGTPYFSNEHSCYEYWARAAYVRKMTECNVDLSDLIDPDTFRMGRPGVRFSGGAAA